MITFVAGFLWGAMVVAAFAPVVCRELDRIRMPYRWACHVKGCRFRIAGGDPALVATWANRHQTSGEHTSRGRT